MDTDKRRWVAIVLIGWAGLSSLACRQKERDEPPKKADAHVVTVQRDASLRETTYSIEQGPCRISWTTYETELNRGGISHRPKCDLPLAQQTPLIAKLLHEVLKAGKFHTLGWGRLYPDGPRDITMAVRLALAAKRSPEWDAGKGKPRNGDINGFVRKLANDASIYEELRPVFRDSGLEIEFASVEKVLVLRATELPFFDRLRVDGVRPRDRLPFDCQTWFSVRPTQSEK